MSVFEVVDYAKCSEEFRDPARSNAVGGREGYRLRHEGAREGKVRGLAVAHAAVESEPIERLTT